MAGCKGCIRFSSIFRSAAWLVFACTQYSGDGSGLPYIPLLNSFDLAPFDLVAAFVLHACWKWTTGETDTPSAGSLQESVRLGCYLGAILWLTMLAARLAHYWGDVPFQIDLLMHSYLMHAILSLIWTVTSISLMIYATRHSRHNVWFAGFRPARHRRCQADDDRPGQQGHRDVDRLADRHRAAGDRGEQLFAGAAKACGGSGGGMIGSATN